MKFQKRNIFRAFSQALCLSLCTLISFGAVGCSCKGENKGAYHDEEFDKIETTEISDVKNVEEERPISSETKLLSPASVTASNPFENKYPSVGEVGFFGKVIAENVDRVKPVSEQKNGGLPRYPVFGTDLKDATEEEKLKIINESNSLTAKDTQNAGGGGYTWMDENGYLYTGSRPATNENKTGRQLYQHTASVGLYHGNVSDEEKGVTKLVEMRPRGYDGYGVTGIYAPAGEVIKITLSDKDMKATGGITVHIGQALYNGQANNIWEQKNMPRMPHLLNTMQVDETTAEYDETNKLWTAYVGSFLGGPLYIRNESSAFSATISGGVEYLHFILGYTDKREFERLKGTSAPYFDLEIWDLGILHSGSRQFAEKFTYEQLYDAAILWEKVTSVTTVGSNQGIVMFYEPFVAAGAAVAFPGRRSVNCPESWFASALDYEGIINSGCWGNFHEYHHNFQGFGVGDGGEVTNNSLTLVSYALFTKISAVRSDNNYGTVAVGESWNNYMSATWALNETKKIADPDSEPQNGDKGLALYATLLHNFGAEKFIETKAMGGGQSYAAYMDAWQRATHNNMYYYFKNILQGTDIEDTADGDYPVFIPVSCLYQTGRSYLYDGVKKYVKTMQPYRILSGQPFEIDLGKYTEEGGKRTGGSIVIPDGFSYKVKSVTKPQNGRIELTDSGTLIYTPDKNKESSGQIIVTLAIKSDKDLFKVEDVDLTLEFDCSHELNKNVLQRTTYTYSAGEAYTDARQAYKSDFAGYTSETVSDHANPVQNANTDIWYYPDDANSRAQHPDAPESYFVHNNTIEVLEGKLYFENEGKYRIYLRGRTNCALYYSTDDGQSYTCGAYINADSPKVSNTANFRPDDSNTYFDVQRRAGSWLYLKEVLIVSSTPQVSYIGVGMQAWNGDAAPNMTSPPYVNAYRCDYEFPKSQFETDYFYTHDYSYDYTDNELVSGSQTLKSLENYAPYNSTHKNENITDGDRNTYIHTNSNVSEEKPLILTLDLGASKSVNRIIIYSQNRSDLQVPVSFKLYGSTDGNDYFELTNVTDAAPSHTMRADFAEKTVRYYKLEISKSSNKFIIMSEIELWHINEITGGTRVSPDNSNLSYGGNWNIACANSSYGHVYVGSSGAKLNFTFSGVRLGIFVSKDYSKSFEVYIDGKKQSSLAIKSDDGATPLVFLSGTLTSGKHEVEIKCTGEMSIDSIVVFGK